MTENKYYLAKISKAGVIRFWSTVDHKWTMYSIGATSYTARGAKQIKTKLVSLYPGLSNQCKIGYFNQTDFIFI
jgi:hypothetical protein